MVGGGRRFLLVESMVKECRLDGLLYEAQGVFCPSGVRVGVVAFTKVSCFPV